MSRCAVVIAVLAQTTAATADDNVGTSDTVASTWSGGVLRLAERDNRFTLALGTLLRPGIRLRGEVSAPLDDKTRRATFVTDDGLAPAFRGSFHIGYDSTYQALELAADDQGLLPYCEANDIKPCTATAAVRHRSREGQPAGLEGRYWSLGLDISYAYDQVTAHVGDIGDGTTADLSSTNLQVGASAMLYAPGGWVASLRAGYERSNPVNVTSFQRCAVLPSNDPAVTGESCSDELRLMSNPGARQTGYVRGAGAYYPTDSALARYVSAVEVRLNFERLGNDAASADVHALLFARGLALGAGSVRLGMGTRVRAALSDGDHQRGDLYDYALFGIVGTTF